MPSMSEEVKDQKSEVNGCCGERSAVSDQLSAVESQPRGKEYWRSLEDLAKTQEFREFMHREFPAGATDMLQGDDRRTFLKLMGASLALAGLGMQGCRRWPEQKIAPYAHRPPEHLPGQLNYFATCYEVGGVASGLIATSSDFRPIKIDGNPQHPINMGGSDALIQASILNLYDPDRSERPLNKGLNADWAAFTNWAKDHFATAKTGIAVLCEATSSPSVLAMKQRFMKDFTGAKWFEYEPLNNDSAVTGSMQAFGSVFRPHYSFDKAAVIVAMDADFLHCDPASIKNSREFAIGRRADDGHIMTRLYAFEAGVSLTGANADHRVAMRSADVAIVAARIAAGVAPGAAQAVNELAAQPISATTDSKLVDETIAHAIEDLRSNRGKGIVMAGPRQPAEVHLLCYAINEALGNVGATIKLSPEAGTQAHSQGIRDLAKAVGEGSVQTLVIIGGNPVYNAPADLKFADLLKAVNTTIHLSEYVDETSALCTWHVNRANYLECWGDGRAYDGTISLAQPMIEPLFHGKSAIELLAAITGDELTEGYDIVRRTFADMSGNVFVESAWRQALHDGVVAKSAMPLDDAHPSVKMADLAAHVNELKSRWSPPKSDELEAIFAQDFCLYDGRYANNGWLQEMPDPITRLTWDNAILMGVDGAKARGLKTGDMVRLKTTGGEVDAPVMLLPGHHSGSVTLSLGYGRAMDGRICKDAGFNFYPLRTSQTMGFAGGATMAKADGTYLLATTQDHYAVDSWPAGPGIQERLPTLFREATLTEYHEHPNFVKHGTHVVHRLSLFDEDMPFHGPAGHEEARYAWAMSIDLNACTGCNACVIACQAENNVPIVGKDQIKRNREMHWLRVDRYFKGGTEALPEGFMLSPLMCNHCENAPCEQVCPVAATVHDADGLNVMVYNRCVGTRYCSNNCPYKVRRFNYFDYWRREPQREQPGVLLQVPEDYYIKSQAKADPLRQMQMNPDVTVRMRGIMEKCTYCVQRITRARIDAKNKYVETKPADRPARVAPIPDGTITPACAQACPAQAIVFGDLRDLDSRVSKLHKHNRSYEMLEELNTKPRTRYMAKIRNPAFGGGAGGHGHSHEEAHPS